MKVLFFATDLRKSHNRATVPRRNLYSAQIYLWPGRATKLDAAANAPISACKTIPAPSRQRSGSEATGDHFDLVITNHLMAEMTGEQLAVTIKKLNPKIPLGYGG